MGAEERDAQSHCVPSTFRSNGAKEEAMTLSPLCSNPSRKDPSATAACSVWWCPMFAANSPTNTSGQLRL